MNNSSDAELTVAIPAFNEAEIIEENINEIREWLGQNLPDVTYEVLIVDDGSNDGMTEILKRKTKINRCLRVVSHDRNMGRGRAIRTAFEESVGRYIIILDADLSYAPEHISLLLEPLRNDEADITLASPYHKEGKIENVPFFRALVSRLGNKILANSFSGKSKTVTCIVRGFTRKVASQLDLLNEGKDLHLELLYKADLLNFRIVEVPAKLVWRDSRRNKLKDSSGSLLTNNTLFKLLPTMTSHLMFNFLAKPRLLFLIPILISFLVSFFGFFSLLQAYFLNLFDDVASPLRETFIQGVLTLFLSISSFILGLIFLSMFFICFQAKKHFDEQYIMLAGLKRLIEENIHHQQNRKL